MARILFGIILGILLVPVTVFLWFQHGTVPVAVADKPFPFERRIVGIPLHARIDRERIDLVPISPDDTNLIAGAHIYADKCAFCHGFHGKPSDIGDNMYPKAPQLWEKHHNGNVVGVSDDPPGETYWKVSNGIRLTGMPSYVHQLTDTEMWQVSLLLANANKPLPPAAGAILHITAVAPPAAGAAQPATN